MGSESPVDRYCFVDLDPRKASHRIIGQRWHRAFNAIKPIRIRRNRFLIQSFGIEYDYPSDTSVIRVHLVRLEALIADQAGR